MDKFIVPHPDLSPTSPNTRVLRSKGLSEAEPAGSLCWLLQGGFFHYFPVVFSPLGQGLPAGTTASQGLGAVLSLALWPLLVAVSRALPPSLPTNTQAPAVVVGRWGGVERAGGWAWAWTGAKGEDWETPGLKALWSRRYRHCFSAPHSLSVSPPWTVLQSCGLGWAGSSSHQP